MKYKERICPVCSKPSAMPEGDICYNCKNEITKNAEMVRDYKKLQKVFNNLINIKHSDLWIGHIYKSVEGMYASFLIPEIDGLNAIFADMLTDILVPMREAFSYDKTQNILNSGGGWNTYGTYRAPKSLQLNCDKIACLMTTIIQKAYDQGVEDGNKLLLNFAEGNISLKEMNERSIKS